MRRLIRFRLRDSAGDHNPNRVLFVVFVCRTVGHKKNLIIGHRIRKLFTAAPVPGPRKARTQTRLTSHDTPTARPSSSDPYGPTRWDRCDRVGLSPLARARGVRRCPRAQTLLLEHGDMHTNLRRWNTHNTTRVTNEQTNNRAHTALTKTLTQAISRESTDLSLHLCTSF